MNAISLLVVLLLLVGVALLLWYWRRSRRRHEIEAQKAAVPIEPHQVELPEDSSDLEQRRHRHRTGETQELKRKIVHGPYREIRQKDQASAVKPGRKPGADGEPRS